MRRLRFIIYTGISFLTAFSGILFIPGTWLNRVLSVTVCTIFSFSTVFCPLNISENSRQVIAASPPIVEIATPNPQPELLAQSEPRGSNS